MYCLLKLSTLLNATSNKKTSTASFKLHPLTEAYRSLLYAETHFKANDQEVLSQKQSQYSLSKSIREQFMVNLKKCC